MIGVNSQIESPNASSSGQAGNVGIGFAIPADTVKSVVAQLKATGKASHAYLGVSSADASGAGAQVAAADRGRPRRRGGLQAGDIITSVGGKSVDDSSALSSLVDAHKAGDSVQVDVTRNGSKKTLTVKLGERPDTTATFRAATAAAPGDPRLRRRLVARLPMGGRCGPARPAVTGRPSAAAAPAPAAAPPPRW